MNCGKYNKRISFYRQCEEEDAGTLQTSQALRKLKSVWASVKATAGTESYESDRLNNTVAYDIRTRYIKEIDDSDLIIIYGGQRLEIRSVVNVREEGRELAFTCVKIKKAGGDYERGYY